MISTTPASAAGSAIIRRNALGYWEGFRSPAPQALATSRNRSGGRPRESTRSSVAPVGVVASPCTGPPFASSSPSSRIAVAGAGTGIFPC